jgi:hypothetical protein
MMRLLPGEPLKALYIDCGTNEQFNLLYGARRRENL